MNAQTPLCVLNAQVAETHLYNTKVAVLMLAEILFSLEMYLFFFPMDELVALVQTQTHSSNNRLTARDMAYYTTYGQQLNVKAFNIKTFFNVQTEPDIYSPIPIIGKLLVPSECLTTSQKKPSCLKIAPTVNAH